MTTICVFWLSKLYLSSRKRCSDMLHSVRAHGKYFICAWLPDIQICHTQYTCMTSVIHLHISNRMSCAYSLVCPGGKMVGAWSFIFLVFLHVANAQSCSVDFAVLEGALLENHVNAYQIANAFFQPRTEGETLCVTAYYYLGLNSTEEDKSNCPSITSNEDAGCSKWKWCINTFYMDLNLAQLQIFSFFAIYERVSEIELRIPPLCSDTMNEYLLRATTSVSCIVCIVIL